MAHRVDGHGDVVHLGETIEVERSRSHCLCFELRLAAVDGSRPGLLLNDIPVSPHALLSEIEHAVLTAWGQG